MKTWIIYLSMLGAAMSIPPATAVSPAAGESQAVPLPGLESDPTGTVDPRVCSVSIAAGQVTVDLSAKPTGDSPALLLNGVLFGWTGDAAPYSERQFPELDIRIDGAPATLQDRFETFVGSTNITNLVKQAQMDPWAITRNPPLTSAHPPTPQVLNGLKNLGAIEKSQNDYLARWMSRRVLRIPLKADAEQQLELRYTARPAVSLLTVAQLDTRTRERAYCVSAAQLDRLPHGGSPDLLSAEEFTIPVGIDGKPPESVTLSVSPEGEGRSALPAHIFFCAPRGKSVDKIAGVTRQRADVDDASNLHVLRVAVPSPAP